MEEQEMNIEIGVAVVVGSALEGQNAVDEHRP
jgi:hypothetical protein